ncbi:MAG: hypothetical protein B6A08_11230 [Sorangiineae bacterium NIC37A_2]|jgi:peptidoglycan/LPS O-acetylase OafA/YrhL|nr:MAG: hypothetical protein B6A08_11230 [Sorangiineae bacterium NIC37A_2]
MSSASPGRLPGLDGLRALAVLLVVFFHQELLGIGWIGVQIFFVLSGFLITRILVQSKELPLRAYLVEFYGRRSLRIFPLYFGVLGAFALLAALGMEAQGVREGLPFAATYTYNFWHASDAFVHSKLISHFWSLCVEEQFYLIWPFFIFFCRPSALRAALLSIVFLGPLVRLGLHALIETPSLGAFEDTEVALYVLTPSHVDAFALGALFSLYPLGGKPGALLGCFAILAASGALLAPRVPDGPLSFGSLGFPLGLAPGYGYIWAYSLLNLCAALTIDCVVHRRLLPGLFESRVMSYIGKISYGVYVFHYPLQSFIRKALPNAPVALGLVVQVTLTLLVASLSFYLWETPFLRKKDVWFKPGPEKGPPARAAA